MANSRARLALTPDEARRYLQDAATLILCTTGPDGLPDPVPMWFVVDPPNASGEPPEPEPGTVLMTTYGKSQKVVNLRRDPRAVGLIEDGTAYGELRGLQLTGRLDVVDDDAEVLETLVRVAGKYSGTPDSPELREGLAGQASKRVLLRLRADKVVSWDHRKM
ncbi:MAG TPA: pyridoxamine 5'-phosphate oxidase family protein [Frankiaceae bacterium]|nr:pyridoxamine 5'-phosphate oxidase family protein [Frankiaceae bacterium]